MTRQFLVLTRLSPDADVSELRYETWHCTMPLPFQRLLPSLSVIWIGLGKRGLGFFMSDGVGGWLGRLRARLIPRTKPVRNFYSSTPCAPFLFITNVTPHSHRKHQHDSPFSLVVMEHLKPFVARINIPKASCIYSCCIDILIFCV
jgi:hypothetical protein